MILAHRSLIFSWQYKKYHKIICYTLQLVWNGSTELGVGRATASNGMQFVVARYNPPGNMLGKFQNNVFPANGKPTVKPSSGNNNNNNRRAGGNKPSKPQTTSSGATGRQSKYSFTVIDNRLYETKPSSHNDSSLPSHTSQQQSSSHSSVSSSNSCSDAVKVKDLVIVQQNKSCCATAEIIITTINNAIAGG